MFRKIILFATLLFAAAEISIGSVYFVDSSTGSDSDNGTTMDLAWATIEHAAESGALMAYDYVFIRRGHSETPTSDVALAYSGNVYGDLTFLGWPRAAHSWNCDFTNGSTTVDNIDENDADREKHQARLLTGPDGFDYLITKITDSNTVIIDRPYAGSTATNQTVSIKADEDWADDMGTAFGFDDSGWTIQESDWDSDADDIPLIDFNAAAYSFYIYRKAFIALKNIEMKNSSDNYGALYVDGSRSTVITNFLGSTSQDAYLGYFNYSGVFLKNVTAEGSSSGSNQNLLAFNFGHNYLENVASYGAGSNAYYFSGGESKLKNVNLCVEVACESEAFWYNDLPGRYKWSDVKVDATNGLFRWSTIISTRSPYPSPLWIVNYNKVKGALFGILGPSVTAEKVAVSSVTPNKKISDYIIELTPDDNTNYDFARIYLKPVAFESRKTYSAGTYDVRVWIYNDTGKVLNDNLFSDDILLRCYSEAAGYGDSDTEYVGKYYYSDEIDIADAADADDWDYLQADDIVVGSDGGKIICEVLVAFYDSEADNVYIDPVTVNP